MEKDGSETYLVVGSNLYLEIEIDYGLVEHQRCRWGLVTHAGIAGNSAHSTLLWSVEGKRYIVDIGGSAGHFTTADTWVLGVVVSTVLMAGDLL